MTERILGRSLTGDPWSGVDLNAPGHSCLHVTNGTAPIHVRGICRCCDALATRRDPAPQAWGAHHMPVLDVAGL
jgi:hypothetical protein